MLSELRLNPIVLAGANKGACMRMTAIDAYQRDMDVIVGERSCGVLRRGTPRITERYMDGKIPRVLSSVEIAGAMLTG